MSSSEDELLKEIRREEASLSKVQSKKPAATTKPITKPSIDVDTRSGLRLKRRLVSEAKCNTGLRNIEYVAIRNVESRTRQFFSISVGVKPSSDWGTVGVIDKCFPQSDFCVTRITDMRGSYSNLYITGNAYAKNEAAIGMGSVVAIKRPILLKPTETHHSIGLHVDRLNQFWVIGQSLDLAQCSSFIRKDVQCTEWTDVRSGDYCDKHLERVCNYSKNGRMELAGGDSGFDIRWATQKRQSDGSILYESKRERRADPTAKLFSAKRPSKDKEAYYLKGRGLVAVDGSLIKKPQAPKREPTAAEKEELTEFLKGRRDPGAEMIRKVKGIKEDSPRTVLSREALDKMGIGIKSLTKEEEHAKKRSFEALSNANKSNNNDEENQKKPRYVYL